MSPITGLLPGRPAGSLRPRRRRVRHDPAGRTRQIHRNPRTTIAEGSLCGRRLVVRRTRLVGAQAELFPDWRYHAFVTNRLEPLTLVERDHRRHAQIELAIRDLKEGSGLNHAPSGCFSANAAWLLISSLAHNLARWIAHLGLGASGPVVAQTIRRRYLTLPGRITRSARRATLHLPARWPWREDFTHALARLRAIPLLA
jgi:hypothetical protein